MFDKIMTELNDLKKRHMVHQSVKGYNRMIDENELQYDFPLQRKKGQWDDLKKSLLIHSIIQDYDIPPVYTASEREVTENGQEKLKYKLLDGLQRLSSIEDFCKNKYKLHKDTPSAVLQDEIYFIAGKTFEELPEVVRDAINDYSLTMFYFVNVSDDELSEMFYRIANGSKHNKQQQMKAKLGIKKAQVLNELTENRFFTEYSGLTPTQIKKADDEQVVVQTLMAMDQEFAEYLSFDNATLEKYMTVLKSSDNEELFENYELTLEYFVEALERTSYDKNQLLKKRYLVQMTLLAKYALDTNVETIKFGEFMLDLSEKLVGDDEVLVEGLKELFAQSAGNKKKDAIIDNQIKLQGMLIEYVKQ